MSLGGDLSRFHAQISKGKAQRHRRENMAPVVDQKKMDPPFQAFAGWQILMPQTHAAFHEFRERGDKLIYSHVIFPPPGKPQGIIL